MVRIICKDKENGMNFMGAEGDTREAAIATLRSDTEKYIKETTEKCGYHLLDFDVVPENDDEFLELLSKSFKVKFSNK